MVRERLLARLSFSASFFALGVIALGAFTRLMDAGLGCPDWPGCYGHIIAPLTDKIAYKAWTEMIHRYFVGMLSVLILLIIATIMSKKIVRTRGNISMAIFLLLLLSYQILLGQWTVTLKLLPIIVTQHLLGGYFILSMLWLLYLNNRSIEMVKNNASSFRILPWAMVGLILLFSQMVLGAWTSTHYASLSCADFPFCSNDQPMVWHLKEAAQVFSPMGVNYEGGVLSTAIRQTIQMLHRFGALIVTAYFIFFFAMATNTLKNAPGLLKSLYIVLGLLCIQLCLGISNVIFKLPLVTAMAHTLVGALLLISFITFIFEIVSPRRSVT